MVKSLSKQLSKNVSKTLKSLSPKMLSAKSLKKLQIGGLLQNKLVLYLVSFLAITNLLGHMYAGNNNAVVFFLLVGYLTSFFSNNMIVVFGTSLAATSLFTRNLREGMAKKEGEKGEEDDNAELKEEDNRNNDLETSQMSEQPHDDEDVEEDEDKEEMPLIPERPINPTLPSVGGMNGMENYKNITKETKELMKSNDKMMETMRSLEPLMGQASEMMKQLEKIDTDGSLTKMAGDIMKKNN